MSSEYEPQKIRSAKPTEEQRERSAAKREARIKQEQEPKSFEDIPHPSDLLTSLLKQLSALGRKRYYLLERARTNKAELAEVEKAIRHYVHVIYDQMNIGETHGTDGT